MGPIHRNWRAFFHRGASIKGKEVYPSASRIRERGPDVCRTPRGIERGGSQKRRGSFCLVPGGPRGRGYVIRNPRTRLSRSAVAARAALRVTLACLGVAASEELASRLVDEMGKAVLGVAQEEVQAKIEDCLESLTLVEERQGVSQRDVVEQLEGQAYEALRDFVHEVEDTARAESWKELREARKGGGGVAKPPFVFFSDVMMKVQSEQDGAIHWVLKEEKTA